VFHSPHLPIPGLCSAGPCARDRDAERIRLPEHDCRHGRPSLHSAAKEQSGGRRREGGQTIRVTLALDTEKREVKPPADFVKALKARPLRGIAGGRSATSHRREHVEVIEQAKSRRPVPAALNGRFA
jgi:hypothetical protein